MDTNSGRFVEAELAEPWMQRIGVGEVVKIKGEECRVTKIEGRRIELELMSAEDRIRSQMGLLIDEPRNRHERRKAEARKGNDG